MKVLNKFAQFGIVGALTLGFAVQADALSISFSDSIALQTTNWSDSVSIPLFDPSLGTLTSIEFYLEGLVESQVQVESLDAAPSTITSTNSAEITLTRPDLSVLTVIEPTVMEVFNASAFDGVIDFGGTSGKDFGVQSFSDSDTHVSPPPVSDLALFTGLGNILLPVSAVGTSSATGAGNLVNVIQTAAGANVRVTYNYNPSNVPEPGAVALLATGAISGLGVLARRRRK